MDLPRMRALAVRRPAANRYGRVSVTLAVLGAVITAGVLSTALLVGRSSPDLSAAIGISSRNPARKDSAWEANGARAALEGAKQLCEETSMKLLNPSPSSHWEDSRSSPGHETTPGRYQVQRTLRRQSGRRNTIRTTVDCTIRRDGDHFQLLAIDTTSR